MAEVTRRGKSFTVRWWEEDARGCRRRRRRSFPRKSQATAYAHQVEAEKARVAAGLIAAPVDPRTLADVVAHLEAGRWQELASANSYRSAWRVHIEPVLGHVVLKDITTERVELFAHGLRGMKPKTKKNLLAILRAILRRAWKLGWLVVLPYVEMPRVDQEEMEFLGSLDEVHRLIEAAEIEGAGKPSSEKEPADKALARRTRGLGLAALYATAAMTGMRAGELAGLRRRDIDFERRQIQVARAYDGRRTKSGRVRYIPLMDALAPTLRRWLATNPMDVVFPTERGTPMQPSDRRFQEAFHRTLRRAGLPRIRFHDLRHSFAALWLGGGGDIYKLSRILGHSSVQVTERYSHLARDAWTAEYGRLGSSESTLPEPPASVAALYAPANSAPMLTSAAPLERGSGGAEPA
jgi:integrase